MKHQSPSPKTFVVALTALLCLINSHSASAASMTWNGGAVPDGNWTNPGNWNGIAPATNSLLIFTGGTQTATTNNFTVGTPFNNLSFNASASPFTLNGNSMILSSPTDAGSGLIAGGSINNASANTQIIRLPIVLASGNHTISSAGGGTLRLNGLMTHSNGAVLTMSGNINVAGALSTNGSSLNGILGGWAVYGNNWATLDANSNVIAYAGYTDVAGGGAIANNPGSNVRIPVNGTAVSITAPTTAINSLLFGSPTASAAAQTINIGAGNKLVLGQNGGVFNNTAVAGAGTYRNLIIGASVAQGGILTAGDGINPATITFGSAPLPSASGFCTVNASIQDNGSAPVTVVVAGAYVSFNGNTTFAGETTNTYSGGTYILQGRVSQPNPYTFGSGPVFIVSGGQANMGCQVPNDFYIEGSGTVENQGMGALRLYRAAAAGNNNLFVGNLPGTIHLTGVANVCSDNITDPALGAYQIGFSGKITGPGSLGIGSPTATTRSGIINISPTNGIGAIANDYAGDTRINGIAGGTVSSTLRIANSANNNIMPHGITGSFNGGKTGNLVLNGVAATRQAIFDLNGSTQTINGLLSTATSPANDFVQDNGPGNGTLIVGDSDATSTFAGAIQNAINITKIGNGTLTLSGANTYNGATLINGGKLITTTASTGAGSYTVAANAALGVTTATLGGTLQVNNLTFSGASALQLSAGNLGNPTAAIVNVTGALTLNGTVTLSLSGVGLTAGGPFTVLTYPPGTRSGAGNFTLVNSPRIVATLNDNTVSGIVSVTILSADSAVKWNGGATGNWDINNNANTIWQTVPSANTTFYIEAGSGNDVALFNDTLTGTFNVTLTTTLSPQAVTVSNSAVNYLFTGPGKLTGTTGLTKQGTGTLTIANSGNNDFSGDIGLTAGTLIISNNSSIPNSISGAGALTKNGNDTMALSGDNSLFTGPVTVNGGTLQVLNTLSLATASATTIADGATLDIALNSVSLGQEPITVSGSGVNGNGAIVNSSGNAAFLLSNFQKLTMLGNTSIGGPGRLDFRATDANNGTDATLSTGGSAYKLTKLSGSQFQLAGVQVDPALGDIDVQAGIFGIQGQISSLGDPNHNLTVFGGATFQLFAVVNVMTKPLVLKDGAIVNNNNGANTYGGTVNLQGTALFNIGGNSVTFTNVISGTGSLSKVTGALPMILTASNTYSGDTFINAGTLQLIEPADIRASRSIFIGTGAILDVTGRADQTLTLLSGHSLSGSGTLNGTLVTLPGGTVAPGANSATLGALSVNGAATLAGTNIMKLNATTLTSDNLFVGGSLTYGGTLLLTNISGTLVPGDSFQLFSAGAYGGSFASIIPATPGTGLTWNTNNLGAGVLGVSGGPAITNFTVSGSSITLQGAFGPVGGQYAVLATTNVAMPVLQWTPIATNFFDGSGNFEFTTNIVGAPQLYFMLRVP